MDYPVMSEDQVEEILDKNPDISADYTKGKRHKELTQTVYSLGWRHVILMGLLVGFLWVLAIAGLVNGFVIMMMGVVNESLWQTIGGFVLLGAGVIFCVCAKLFHEKVQYGEV